MFLSDDTSLEVLNMKLIALCITMNSTTDLYDLKCPCVVGYLLRTCSIIITVAILRI